MTKEDVINIIGPKYRTSNLKNGRFSYAKVIGNASRMGCDGDKPITYQPELRFVKRKVVVLVVLTSNVTFEADKDLLFGYYEGEYQAHGWYKAYGVLINVDTNKVYLERGDLGHSFPLREESALMPMDYYVNLASSYEHIDSDGISRIYTELTPAFCNGEHKPNIVAYLYLNGRKSEYVFNEVKILSFDHKWYESQYDLDSVTEEEVMSLLPGLDKFEPGFDGDVENVPQGYHYEYLGMGNHLFVHEKYAKPFKCIFDRISQDDHFFIYQTVLDAILANAEGTEKVLHGNPRSIYRISNRMHNE